MWCLRKVILRKYFETLLRILDLAELIRDLEITSYLMKVSEVGSLRRPVAPGTLAGWIAWGEDASNTEFVCFMEWL